MIRTLSIAAILVLTGCATLPSKQLDLSSSEIVDLTHAFDSKTLYWPSSPFGFQLEQLSSGQTPGGYFYSANALRAPEHGGTHLDAPVHFAEPGMSVDELSLRQLMAPAITIDITAQAAANPDYLLTREDVLRWESEWGPIPPGAVVLLRTGWSAKYTDRKAYFGDDAPGVTSNLHFPSFGEDAARLLVDGRRAGALGVDTASIDGGQSRNFMVHRIAAAANVAGLENLSSLAALPARGHLVIALPMKIAGGSGGPVRVVAVIPRATERR